VTSFATARRASFTSRRGCVRNHDDVHKKNISHPRRRRLSCQASTRAAPLYSARWPRTARRPVSGDHPNLGQSAQIQSSPSKWLIYFITYQL
jgi:hypothetical protein